MLSPTWFFPGLFLVPRGLKTHVSACRGSAGQRPGFSAQAGAGVDRVGLLLSRRLRDRTEAVNQSTKLWKGKGIHRELEESATFRVLLGKAQIPEEQLRNADYWLPKLY